MFLTRPLNIPYHRQRMFQSWMEIYLPHHGGPLPPHSSPLRPRLRLQKAIKTTLIFVIFNTFIYSTDEGPGYKVKLLWINGFSVGFVDVYCGLTLGLTLRVK